jgi:hypothetical protein
MCVLEACKYADVHSDMRVLYMYVCAHMRDAHVGSVVYSIYCAVHVDGACMLMERAC